MSSSRAEPSPENGPDPDEVRAVRVWLDEEDTDTFEYRWTIWVRGVMTFKNGWLCEAATNNADHTVSSNRVYPPEAPRQCGHRPAVGEGLSQPVALEYPEDGGAPFLVEQGEDRYSLARWREVRWRDVG